ncbi:meiotic recombination [Pleodorina starrii]|nr:meiotic recombination [Pleodorina starrii]
MSAVEAGDPNLLRILISTDNHLGVWEKDQTRRDDSFRSFEEVLQLAVEKRVDMVLLGGDLFHENKPSRSTLVKAIHLFSKYCLNDRPVRFRILSDQRVNFVSGRVNFENPNLNIGLPVFTIHGNHDDPSGQDSLSAVDILSQTGLVNYFGKHPLVGSGAAQVTLSPVLIEKGATRLCMYGLGNIRDERLGRSFQTPGCVQWQRPASSPGYPSDGWVNMFVLHQNRVQHTAFAKACVREEHLPPFLDLAVWGHEHECRPDAVPIRGEGEGRYVVQPGSTVATALSEGESRPKHALLLEVKAAQFRLQKFRLRTVRPFEFEFVALKDAKPPLRPEDAEGVADFLAAKIQEMITRAAASALQLPSADPGASGGGAPGSEGAPRLPLIRLRVDYTGFSTVNAQRLGQRFVGKVANPNDMLQWTKAATRKVKAEGEGGSAAGGGYEEEEGGYLRPEALDQSRIEDLIRQHLGPNALEVLPDDELAIALHNFVEKDDKNALTQCIEAALEETRNAAAAAAAAAAAGEAGAGGEAGAAEATGVPVVKKGRGGEEEELMGAVRAGVERRKQQRRQRILTQGDEDGVDLSALEAGITQGGGGGGGTGAYGGGMDEHMADAGAGVGPSQAATNTTTTGRGRGRGRGGRQQSLADSLARGRGRGAGGTLDAFLQPASTGPAAAPARGRGGRAAAGARGAGARGHNSDVEMADVVNHNENNDRDEIEDLEDEQQQQPQPVRNAARRGGGALGRGAGGRGSAAAAATPGRARSTRAAATGAGRKSYRVDDSDAEEEDDGSDAREGIEDEDDEEDVDDEDMDDEDDMPRPSAGRGRGKAAAGRGGAAAAAKRSVAGRGRGRGAGAVAAPGGGRSQSRGSGRGTRGDAITLTSDEEDDEPAPSLGPPAARAHAAAGAAFVGHAAVSLGTATTQGGTGTLPGSATGGAAGGGRKRPASFFASGRGVRPGRGAAAGAGGDWGPVR